MRSKKSEWISRLRSGAGDKASRPRPSVDDDHLQADARLKQLQAQCLEDEHKLLSLKRREYELNIENAEIKRGLTLLGVVVIGAILVAGLVLGIADPGLAQPGPNPLELCKLLLGL